MLAMLYIKVYSQRYSGVAFILAACLYVATIFVHLPILLAVICWTIGMLMVFLPELSELDLWWKYKRPRILDKVKGQWSIFRRQLFKRFNH